MFDALVLVPPETESCFTIIGGRNGANDTRTGDRATVVGCSGDTRRSPSGTWRTARTPRRPAGTVPTAPAFRVSSAARARSSDGLQPALRTVALVHASTHPTAARRSF